MPLAMLQDFEPVPVIEQISSHVISCVSSSVSLEVVELTFWTCILHLHPPLQIYVSWTILDVRWLNGMIAPMRVLELQANLVDLFQHHVLLDGLVARATNKKTCEMSPTTTATTTTTNNNVQQLQPTQPTVTATATWSVHPPQSPCLHQNWKPGERCAVVVGTSSPFP